MIATPPRPLPGGSCSTCPHHSRATACSDICGSLLGYVDRNSLRRASLIDEKRALDRDQRQKFVDFVYVAGILEDDL